MDSGTVLLIAIPILFGLAVLLVVATTVARGRSTTAALTRETRKSDKSAVNLSAEVDLDEMARERYAPSKEGLDGEGSKHSAPEPPDPETIGISRRQFFNRGIVGLQLLSIGSFGAASLAFLYTGLKGGFGGEINAGKLKDILAQMNELKEPFYVPAARTYLAPYPSEATVINKAKAAYASSLIPGMEEGLVALYQKCPHLGCKVPWCQTAQWFECPCHGSKYNRVGEKKGGPAPRGMDRWPIAVKNGEVIINTGLVSQGPPVGTNTTGQEAEGPHCV